MFEKSFRFRLRVGGDKKRYLDRAMPVMCAWVKGRHVKIAEPISLAKGMGARESQAQQANDPAFPVKGVKVNNRLKRCGKGPMPTRSRSSTLEPNTAMRYTWKIPGDSNSITPRPTLGSPQLVHLRDPQLELLVLALLVAVSFGLSSSRSQHTNFLSSPLFSLRIWYPRLSSAAVAAGGGGAEKKETYLAFPRQVVFFEPASVQRDEQVGATVAVGDRESGFGHGGS